MITCNVLYHSISHVVYPWATGARGECSDGQLQVAPYNKQGWQERHWHQCVRVVTAVITVFILYIYTYVYVYIYIYIYIYTYIHT